MLKTPRTFVACGLYTCCLILAGTAAVRADGPKVDFNRDIRPLLSDKCYKCHGPDEAERKAKLRLDQQDGALAALESGAHAVVAGKSAESELYLRIVSADPAEKMPPPASGKSLTPQQVELLKRWIDEGATWRGHWSFVKPETPEPPQVQQTGVIRNPIDRFILQRLDQDKLQAAPAADKVTLIRRLTYDITGLPPAPAEIDAFLADDSANAYEKVVDRLLASPRYGEHMARYWLDAARYGDTHGLHFDNERSLWKYRDWVISAFNNNLPFDRFTVEQLAGDLLPNSTMDQQIATGFNRCNVSTSEGGSIDDEVLVRYAVDRVETTATVWLGLTAGCAVCHDHKFDPLTQKEFYRLFAFFSGVADRAMDGNQIGPPPVIKTPSAEQESELKRLNEQIAQSQQQALAELAKVEYVDPAAATGAGVLEPEDYVWIDDALPAGAKPSGPDDWSFVAAPEPVFSGEKSNTRTSEGVSQHFFTEAKPGLRIGEGDKLFAYVHFDLLNAPKAVMLQFNDGTWDHRAVWGDDVIEFGVAGTPGRVPMGALPEAGEWVRIEVEAAKVGLKPGSVLNGWAFTQYGGTVHWDRAGVLTRTPQDGQGYESQLVWEAFERTQTKSTLPAPVQEALKVDAATRNDAQKKTLRDHFLQYVCLTTRGQFDPLNKQFEELTKKQKDLDGAIPTTMVMADMPQSRETFVLIRGAYDKKGEKVTAGVPAWLPALPEGAPVNRLGLAQWLVDPAHPLTSRVTVNRFWQQYFGTGIVKTSEDFGAQGQWPSHPELLDWLATEFIRTGWNVKELQKLIVMSNTYQQSSRVTPDALQRDPANELLARGPRFRLDAEVIRDAALGMSGLLVERRGGRSVRPYQPEGLWEAVGFLGSNTSIFKQDAGESLYRRSLYTFWKRTSPPPSLLTFDAPSRETCAVRRPRTNTPLQALVLMNDKQYVEAARRLAERVITEGGATPEERLSFAFRVATARRPQPEELSVLTHIFRTQLAEFQADKDAAAKLIAYGDSPANAALDASELAAYTMLANLVMNLDETVTKE